MYRPEVLPIERLLVHSEPYCRGDATESQEGRF